jgi:hypothetical protein
LDLREIGWDGRDWIELAQDRDQWRALVKFSEWLHNWQLLRKGSAPYVSKYNLYAESTKTVKCHSS